MLCDLCRGLVGMETSLNSIVSVALKVSERGDILSLITIDLSVTALIFSLLIKERIYCIFCGFIIE